MYTQTICRMGLALCIIAMLAHCAVSHPLNNFDTNLTEKDKQDILHSAAKIIRLVLGDSQHNALPSAHKRNPGTLDAVLDMPNLFDVGRK